MGWDWMGIVVVLFAVVVYGLELFEGNNIFHTCKFKGKGGPISRGEDHTRARTEGVLVRVFANARRCGSALGY